VSSEPDEVTVYLLDRAGDAANAFAAKLQGREGVFLVGGAGDVEEALDDIGVASPEVILVGTDLGGSGVVAAVERVLAIAPDAAVVALSTSADKALVAQAVRSGAAGSLDRAERRSTCPLPNRPRRPRRCGFLELCPASRLRLPKRCPISRASIPHPVAMPRV
jgi:hypothetical protein